MVNNIPSYYHVKIFIVSADKNIINIKGPKWPIHVINYIENKWISKIYEIQDKYMHPIHGFVTVFNQ